MSGPKGCKTIKSGGEGCLIVYKPLVYPSVSIAVDTDAHGSLFLSLCPCVRFCV